MEITPTRRRQLRLQSLTFVVLFLSAVGLVAWLGTRYVYEADWTANGRHTLSETSVRLLGSLAGPVRVTAFAREAELSPMRERIRQLVGRYRRHKADLSLDFVDPDLEPVRVRDEGVTMDGELVVEYGGRRENLKVVGEQSLTNALQRLARSGARHLVFLQGHGERRPEGKANYDLGEWLGQLQGQGFRASTLALTQEPVIPEDTAVLVIAGPASDYLAGEVAVVRRYLEGGGNLLWLADPGPLYGLEPLAALLGIEWLPGTVVDPTSQMLGIDNPAFVVVAQYPEHPVAEDLTTLTLFPLARPLRAVDAAGWETEELLRTLPRSWAESDKLTGAVAFDQGKDLAGPLAIGLLLTRERPGSAPADGAALRPSQRVAAIGDGDFLANTYLGNGANRELADRLVNWLSHDDSFIAIPPRAAPDTRLELSPGLQALLGLGFLVVLPAVLVGSGVAVWWQRRKR